MRNSLGGPSVSGRIKNASLGGFLVEAHDDAVFDNGTVFIAKCSGFKERKFEFLCKLVVRHSYISQGLTYIGAQIISVDRKGLDIISTLP